MSLMKRQDYIERNYNEFVYPNYSSNTNFSGSIQGVEVEECLNLKEDFLSQPGGALVVSFYKPKSNQLICIVVMLTPHHQQVGLMP